MLRKRARMWIACVLSVGAVSFGIASVASAQSGQQIKIGYSMAMTGGLAANGKSALLAQKIWEEDINSKGGLLGRPVKLIFYDDQSSPAQVPGIYTKLLDVDKVDLIIGAYATAQIAPAMPIAIQRKKTLIGLMGLAVNSEFKYPNYFSMIPSGGTNAKVTFTKGFFDIAAAQNPKPQTVAIVAADQEFSRNAADGARENAKAAGFKIVYDKTYPPANRFHADRAFHPSDKSRSGRHLLISTGLGGHGAGHQRDRVQTQNDRRCNGWIAKHRYQNPTGSASEWLDQLRLLASVPEVDESGC